MDKNKVTFGLSNVHIWPITATSEDGTPTYGTLWAEKGATEISLDMSGDSTEFYADNVKYYVATANNGYSGTATFARMSDSYREKILKEVTDQGSVHFENADNVPTEFAMAYEIEGDVSKTRFLFYRCSGSRPKAGSATKENGVTVNTEQININAMPRIDNKYVKAWCDDTASTAYTGWYGAAPYEYVATT